MQIISHRGYWLEPAEKNTAAAFERSFMKGFGTETDFRDCGGRLVIAHDLPGTDALDADRCFKLLATYGPSLPLAINIKADGLQGLLKAALERHGITNYFLFDMSVPDAVVSWRSGLRFFTRHSDVEQVPALYNEAAGVWIDGFSDDSWITPKVISGHLTRGMQVCLVSPELHRRPHLAFWERLKCAGSLRSPDLILCTDKPEEARHFFS